MNLSPLSPPNTLRRLELRLLAAVFCLGACTPVAAKSPPAPSGREITEKKNTLKEVRTQIDVLRKDMSRAENKRASVADQLQAVEREISGTQRDLLALSRQRGALQNTLREINAQARELEGRLNGQQERLAGLVYRQYIQGNPDAWHVLLSGQNPNQSSRDLYYLAAIGKARSALAQDMEDTLQRKKALAATSRERERELAGIETKQKAEQEKLLAQRAQRKALMDRISAQIAQQRREIGNLQRDEKRLSQLVDRLRRNAIPRPTVPRKPATTGKAPAPEIRNERLPQATPGGNFARLQGRLRLPAQGSISNRFGSARQEGSTWKGLFIRAAQGGEVRAIAAGRVVFADWMRGFGNLIIVDHGDGYLSIYGNNDAVLKQLGDTLHGGEVIAAVGNSGGNPESGLYFELRYRGQPIDPLKWVNLK